MNVLVTGSSGLIGRTVVRTLTEAGHKVKPFDRAEGFDILDAESCLSAVQDMDAVIHLAGILGTDELFDEVHKAIAININGSVNVMSACAKEKAHYIGITMPPVFPSIYTATKVSASRFATAFHHNQELPVTNVKAFNAFGSDQHHGPGHPRKIIPALSVEGWNNIPMIIWGDGEQTVDLIHVDDIALVFLDALFAPGKNETIDAGSGKSFTVNEVAKMVLDVTGSTAGVEHLPMRRGEIPTNIVALGEGWEYLTFTPSFDYEKLVDTIKAYKDHG